MLVTANPRSDSDGSIVRQFTDSINSAGNTYTYDTTQDNLTIWNKGYVPITLNAGTYSNVTIEPLATWENDVSFTEVTIQANGISEIQVTAKEYDNKPVYKKDLAGQIPTDLLDTINGHTSALAEKSTKIALENTTLYQKALKEIENVNVNQLLTFNEAVKKQSVKICFWGDSISEGYDIIDYYNYAKMFIDILQKKYPNVTFNSQNYCLAGRDLEASMNDTYIPYNTPQDVRSWTVASKSWKQYIVDYQPDLLIMAFGMNDTWRGNNAMKNEKTQLDSFKTWINTFVKVPSICLVSTILPALTYVAQRQDLTQGIARVWKSFAKENGYILADANRLFTILRDGIDTTIYETNTLAITTPPTTKYYNLEVTATINIKETTLSKAPYFEFRRADGDICFVRVYLLGEGYINPYFYKTGLGDGESLGYISCPSLVLNTDINIQIKFIDNIITVYINGILKATINSYSDLMDGFFNFGSIDGTPTISNIVLTEYKNVKTEGIYSDLELFNATGDTTTNGNGINHLCRKGHELIYLPAMNSIGNNMLKTDKPLFPMLIKSNTWSITGDTVTYPRPVGCDLKYIILSIPNNFDLSFYPKMRNLTTGEWIPYYRSKFYGDNANMVSHNFSIIGKFLFYTVPTGEATPNDFELYYTI